MNTASKPKIQTEALPRPKRLAELQMCQHSGFMEPSQPTAIQVPTEGVLCHLGALTAGELGAAVVPELPVEQEAQDGVNAGLKKVSPTRPPVRSGGQGFTRTSR